MSKYLEKGIVPPTFLAIVLAAGAIFVWIAATMAVLIVIGPFVDPWLSGIRNTSAAFAWIVVGYLLSPFCTVLVLYVGVPLVELRRLGPSHAMLFEWLQLASFQLPMLTACLICFLVAVYFYRRHQLKSDRAALAWATFIFIWGLPGIVGYLLHRNWPPAEVCQNCGKSSPRDRDSCLHCKTAFPPPEMKGIEVFA